MTDEELLDRAAQAGYNYRKVYGSFPDTIGIHWHRLRGMSQTCLMFPEPPPIVSRWWLSDVSLDTPLLSCLHRMLLEPVDGPDINYDEIYVPVPELPDGYERVRSGESLARMVSV